VASTNEELKPTKVAELSAVELQEIAARNELIHGLELDIARFSKLRAIALAEKSGFVYSLLSKHSVERDIDHTLDEETGFIYRVASDDGSVQEVNT
jgi:hypothetical protein